MSRSFLELPPSNWQTFFPPRPAFRQSPRSLLQPHIAPKICLEVTKAGQQPELQKQHTGIQV
jgi:hypothetical protein